MTNREISRQIQRLRNLINRASIVCGGDAEIQSHWAKYICVVCAGLLENALKEIYTDYASKQVSKPIANFVSSKLSQIRNPKSSVFLETAVVFNTIWRSELEDFMRDEGRGDAIDSIINNRHLIAHGSEQNSGVTISQVKDWLDKAIEVIEFIETQCQR
ncbi:MAG: hypothetical protein HC881_17515 [Leptolyngbyaceae cyanobacterium SL_7_1]|nr:hypothetical protein [Leptolyngbyaceae cyanobacterium SL_7_1]